jgi:hypothetical protein
MSIRNLVDKFNLKLNRGDSILNAEDPSKALKKEE